MAISRVKNVFYEYIFYYNTQQFGLLSSLPDIIAMT